MDAQRRPVARGALAPPRRGGERLERGRQRGSPARRGAGLEEDVGERGAATPPAQLDMAEPRPAEKLATERVAGERLAESLEDARAVLAPPRPDEIDDD